MAVKWALMVRTVDRRWPEFDEFDESTIDKQREMGWELLACDSEIPYAKWKPPEPSQSNPIRTDTPEDDGG